MLPQEFTVKVSLQHQYKLNSGWPGNSDQNSIQDFNSFCLDMCPYELKPSLLHYSLPLYWLCSCRAVKKFPTFIAHLPVGTCLSPGMHLQQRVWALTVMKAFVFAATWRFYCRRESSCKIFSWLWLVPVHPADKISHSEQVQFFLLMENIHPGKIV